jgi:GxxExxY protein
MVQSDDRIDGLRGAIIGCAIEVHRRLGPGLLESVYKTCLIIELQQEKLRVETERPIQIVYRGRRIEENLFIDILVEDLIVVEVKSVAALAPVHTAQVITYLKLADRPAGLLLNFNVDLIKNGVRRIVHPDLFEKNSRQSATADRHAESVTRSPARSL